MIRPAITVAILAGFISLSRAEPPALSLRASEPLAAFTQDHPIQIDLALAAGPAWHGFVRVERFDLLDETTAIDYVPVDTTADQPWSGKYAPQVPNGVYRIDATLVGNRDEVPAAKTGTWLFFAYAPAHDPHSLPDDWPLGCHVTFEDTPLPGFKWYRYFSSWAQDNPSKGTYDWARFDSIFARIRDMGGRLLIANDSTPSWTAPTRPVSRPWDKNSTAYPPDDMNDFRTFVEALLKRYDDQAGTLAGLEVWNEPNTTMRWLGTPAQMVELARIYRESVVASQARVHRSAPVTVVGISESSGDAPEYVQGVVKAGILPYLDVVSGHWYEETLTYDPATPFGSLPTHLEGLSKPMHAAGFSLPIWNTECGIACAARENGRIVPQDEINRRAIALPGFDAKEPWKLDQERWRDLSERRAAASYIAGIAMLMSLGVEKTFVYTMPDQNWTMDGAPSLSWVTLSVFGDQIRNLDFHTIEPIPAKPEGPDTGVRSLAYRFGAPNQPGLIVAWSYLQDLKVGRPKIWQPWLAPHSVKVDVSAPEVEIINLYGREKKKLAVTDGSVVLPIGEEPVYLRELPADKSAP